MPLEILATLGSNVQRTISGGSVLALATICLLQYLSHLRRISHVRRENSRLHNELEGLETELTDVQKDRTLAQLENNILREFVAQTEVEKSLELILRRYILNPREGFAAFIQCDGDACRVTRSRGLSEESLTSVTFEQSLWPRLNRERLIVLRDAELHQSRLSDLSPEDRRKARILYVVAVGDGTDLLGAFVTTSLYPAGATGDQQLELARRLMASVAANLKRSRALTQQEIRLRSTHEMLELRRITDQPSDTPLKLLAEFVDALRAKVDADRGALYLNSDEEQNQSMARCGRELPSHLLARWHQHEDILCEQARHQTGLVTLGTAGLALIGVETLIGQSLVLPLSNARGRFGVVCLSRQSREPFTAEQIELVEWAGQHLAETIVRVLAQAAVARQARFDGLTELANRRTFDFQIEHEIEVARTSDTDCSLLLVDIDHFKTVNDTFGHLAGDEVLRQVARVLREQALRMRSGDRALIARYGGEEMAILLPGISTTGALRIGEGIRTAIEQTTIDFGEHLISVTASVGVATFARHAGSVQELIAAADAALYRAKSEGRNSVVAATMPEPSLANLS